MTPGTPDAATDGAARLDWRRPQMPRSDMPTLDTDAFKPAGDAGNDHRAPERAEPNRIRRDGTARPDRSAIEYCIDNDLI
jgi:hypothetical protein